MGHLEGNLEDKLHIQYWHISDNRSLTRNLDGMNLSFGLLFFLALEELAYTERQAC